MKTNSIYGLVTLSALFWGMNFALAQPVMADEPPLYAAAFRFLLASAIMLVLAVIRGEPLLARARRHAGAYLLLGTVGIGAFNLFFFFALQRTSAANASLIMATNPLLTTLLAALMLGERASVNQLAALPLALLGVTVVISGGHLQQLASLHVATGDLIMLGADLAWAFYNVLGRRYMPAGSPLANTTLMMLAGTLVLVIAALTSHEVPAVPGMKSAAGLVMMAVGGTVLAYLFWTTGIARLGAGKTALFLNLVPVFAMLVATTMGILPTTAQLVGGVLVIGAVLVATMPRRQPVPVAAAQGCKS